MSTLRQAAQQALEALRCVDLQSLVPDYGSGHYSVARLDGPQVKSAITAMEAALAEPVQEPVAWRTFDGEGGYDYRTYEDNEDYAAEWAKRNPRHVGWVEPLYAAPHQPPAEPVQEPVVNQQLTTEPVAYSLGRTLYWHEGKGVSDAQLYLAPPQRKPLTEEEIWHTYKNLWMFHPAEEPRLAGDVLKFARAIERAHGIT